MQREKIIDKQFLLIINGPSCGGKSSVSNVLFEKYDGIFNAKGDTIKWLISGYTPLTHRSAVHDMIVDIIKIAIPHKFSILKEGASYEPEKYIEIAKANNLLLFIVNIEAPWEVLTKRFEERIEAKKQGVKKIANVDPVRFKELYEEYNKTKMDTPLVFDSSKQSPEDIAEQIVKYMRESTMSA